MCERGFAERQLQNDEYIHIHVRICDVCACVCVCVDVFLPRGGFKMTCIYIYDVCECVCVCGRVLAERRIQNDDYIYI